MCATQHTWQKMECPKQWWWQKLHEEHNQKKSLPTLVNFIKMNRTRPISGLHAQHTWQKKFALWKRPLISVKAAPVILTAMRLWRQHWNDSENSSSNNDDGNVTHFGPLWLAECSAAWKYNRNHKRYLMQDKKPFRHMSLSYQLHADKSWSNPLQPLELSCRRHGTPEHGVHNCYDRLKAR